MLKIVFSIITVLYTLVGYSTALFLKSPNLSDDTIIEYKIESCALGNAGIRLEAERINDKLIVHNYGYGNSSLTLGLGGAQEAVYFMEQISRSSLSKDKPIAIIGAGVIGLAVAQELLDRGYKVILYSKDFPPNTSSCSACSLFDLRDRLNFKGSHKDRLSHIKKIAWNKLHAMAQMPQIADGIRTVDCFLCGQGTHQLGEPVTINFSSGLKTNAMRQTTFVVIGSLFVPKLFELVKNRGAQCICRSFDRIQDLVSLPETVIFNCTGIGARQLCNDSQVCIDQQSLVCLKNPANIDYAVIYEQDPSISCMVYPGNDCLIVRGSLAMMSNNVGGHEYICQALLNFLRSEGKEIKEQAIAPALVVDSAAKQSVKPSVMLYDESLNFALKKLQCKGNEKILLWGCNNSSAAMQLAAKVPRGSVVGMDAVPELIQEAKNKCATVSNLSFNVLEQKKLRDIQVYDYAVALMPMNMPLDQQACDSLYVALKQKSAFVAMVPINNQHPFFVCLRAGIKDLYPPRTFDEASCPTLTILESNEIKAMLTNAGFKSVMISESLCPLQFAHRQAFHEWIYQLMRHIPCLNEFHDEAKKICFANSVEGYLSRYASNSHELLRYDMPFVLIYAQK